jgi:hypothetical protein
VYIPNYTASQKHPCGLSTVSLHLDNFAGMLVREAATVHTVASPVSSLKFIAPSGFNPGFGFEVGTSFYLYGIKNS